jgi:hypothetical protein
MYQKMSVGKDFQSEKLILTLSFGYSHFGNLSKLIPTKKIEENNKKNYTLKKKKHILLRNLAKL